MKPVDAVAEFPAAGSFGERREEHDGSFGAREIEDDVAAGEESWVIEAGLPETDTPFVCEGLGKEACGMVMALDTSIFDDLLSAFGAGPIGVRIHLNIFCVVTDHTRSEGGVRAWVGGGALDPKPEEFTLVRRGLDAVVRVVEQFEQATGATTEGFWGVVTFGLIAAIGEQPSDGEHVVAMTVDWAVVTGEKETAGAGAAAGGLLVTVTIGA